MATANLKSSHRRKNPDGDESGDLRERNPQGIIQHSFGERRVGRKRINQPDPSIPEGQCALYLQQLLGNRDVDALAEAIGKHRSTLFKYLSGETTPSDSVRDQIAKAIGLRDYRDLMPPDDFLASIRPKVSRKKRSG